MPSKSSRFMTGFTLVELLVVLSIIAILATIGLVMLGSVQKSGRTAKRIEDLKAIKTALELYYSVNKKYPESTNWTSACDEAAPLTALTSALVPTYMPVFPSDPSMDTTSDKSCYIYKSDGTDYKLKDDNITDFLKDEEYDIQPNLEDPKDSSAWAIYSSATSRDWN